MKPHKIVWEFTDYVGSYEISAQVEEISYEDYELTIFIDEEETKCLTMGSLAQCKQYTYWFVAWAREFVDIFKNLFCIR